jgi:GcrA cell cycle regulator
MSWNGSWDDATTVTLAEALEKGLSFKEAAEFVNEKHGTSFSRMAALGRANREGLKSKRKNGDNDRFHANGHVKGRPMYRTPVQASVVTKRRPIIPAVPIAEPAPVIVEEALNVTLEQLEDGMCKWMTGSLTYCGCRTTSPRKPYCAAHQNAGIAPARYRGLWASPSR